MNSVIRALCLLSALSTKRGVSLTPCTTTVDISDSYSDGCCLVVNGTCRTVIDNATSCNHGSCLLGNGTESLFRCGSLQAGLELARELDSCTEIMLLSGKQHAILSPVTIDNSLVLRSDDPRKPAWVTVSVERTPQPPKYEPFYILTVSNAELVIIEGVGFSRSPGIINIENVRNVTVSHCNFRYVVPR